MCRIAPLLAALCLVGFSAAPASSAGSEVPFQGPPARVQVEDPAGDANGVNDHGNGSTHIGDVSGPANIDDEGDLLRVWFTNTARTITVHIQTTVTPAKDSGLRYVVDANRPSDGSSHGCVYFSLMLADGSALQGKRRAWVGDFCDSSIEVPAKMKIGSFSDGTGHVSLTASRALSYFAEGQILEGPHAQVRLINTTAVPFFPMYSPHSIDTTAEGTNYKLRD